MRTTILVLVAALYVCGVRAQSEACLEATEAALKFRDHALTVTQDRSQEVVSRMVKDAAKYFDLNLYEEQEIQDFMCQVIDAEEKTIQSIALRAGANARQMAFLYSGIVAYVQGSLTHGSNMNFKLMQVNFYDKTGFPNFPLKISEAELGALLDTMENWELAEMFWHYREPRVQGQIGFNREKFLSDLTNALSLADFTFEMKYSERDQSNHWELYRMAELDAQQALNETEKLYESVRLYKEEMLHKENFHAVLKRAGFLGVTRGGPELYSCDFIADTAVEALGLLTDIWSRDQFQMMFHYLKLNFTVDDTEALRQWVCEIAASKTQKDVMKHVPDDMFAASDKDDTKYNTLAIYIQGLMAGFSVGKNLDELRMVSYIGSLDFPLSRDNAMQCASLLHAKFPYTDYDQEFIVNVLMAAESFDEAVFKSRRKTQMLYRQKETVDRLEGKVDLVVKLLTRIYELAISFEEHGLFMLPADE